MVQTTWPAQDCERAATLLQGLEEQVDGIIVSAESSRLSQGQVEDLRERLRMFKSDLGSHVRRLRSLERDGELNQVEKAVLLPALCECSANLQVRVNTRPGPKWSSNLAYCRVDLSHALHQLSKFREQGPSPKPRQ